MYKKPPHYNIFVYNLKGFDILKQKIGIIFGGVSSEHEISLMSATSILENIDTSLFDAVTIGIRRDGRALLYKGSTAAIKDGSWENCDVTPCIISPDPSHHGVLLFDGGSTVIRLDAAFPVLHGKNGEDGSIQGLLTLAQIPFVGSGILASAACMDKAVTHALLESVGIKTAKWVAFTNHEYLKDPEKYLNKIENELGLPCFVKPANAGSSVGVSKAKNRDGLVAALELAFKNDYKVVCEKAVVGKEIECAVLGNQEPIASCVGEIEACKEFYDYEAKYIDGTTNTYVPARIEAEHSEKIREISVSAYKALGCSGLSRVDFFLDENGEVILNELNTLPGFTSISMYPKLFEESGIPYKELITRLIELACANNL